MTAIFFSSFFNPTEYMTKIVEPIDVIQVIKKRIVGFAMVACAIAGMIADRTVTNISCR